jgi:hypothetical protein
LSFEVVALRLDIIFAETPVLLLPALICSSICNIGRFFRRALACPVFTRRVHTFSSPGRDGDGSLGFLHILPVALYLGEPPWRGCREPSRACGKLSTLC